MQLPPPEVTSHWPTPNYVDPETRGTGVLIAILVLSLFATLAVGLRIFTRLRISKCYGLDDTLILLAIVPAMTHATLVILTGIEFDGNRHVWDVHIHNLIIARKTNLAIINLFATSSAFTKLSILFFTRRLTSRASSRTYSFAILIAVMVIIVEFVTFNFIIIFQCHPVDRYWTVTKKASSCINESKILTSAGIINTLTDFLVVSIPIPTIWTLHMPLRRRIEIISLITASITVCLAGIARTIYTYRYTSTWDTTWMAYPVWISSTIELDIGIVCASIPALNPLISRLFSSPLAENSASNGTSTARTRTNEASFHLSEFRAQHSSVTPSAATGDADSQKGILYSSSTAL